MTHRQAHKHLWWQNPALWDDPDHSEPQRPTERQAFARIRRQARQHYGPLLHVIIVLDRWYKAYHPEVIPYVRVQLLARRLDMPEHAVSAALREADHVLESLH